MIVKFIEVTNGQPTDGFKNWGKFMVCHWELSEWLAASAVDKSRSLLDAVGWTQKHILVVDLQTGEGAVFLHGGLASADLNNHKIWVCPLFEPFLTWLYQQDITQLQNLPTLVNLPDAPFAMQGYRRPGPKEKGST